MDNTHPEQLKTLGRTKYIALNNKIMYSKFAHCKIHLFRLLNKDNKNIIYNRYTASYNRHFLFVFYWPLY